MFESYCSLAARARLRTKIILFLPFCLMANSFHITQVVFCINAILQYTVYYD